MANALSKFFIKVKAAFSNGFILYNWLSSYTVDCPILYNWACNNFILADKLFAKALRNHETCVLVNNSLRGKLLSSLELPTTFGERFKITSAPFFYS